MRQIYNYSVIRYFPTTLSDEFINIGVFLHGYSEAEKIMSQKSAEDLYCSQLIGDKKKLIGIVEYLNELSISGKLQDSNHYFNNFRFSDAKQIATSNSVEKIIEDLYYDFIGYKFQDDTKIPIKMKIIKNSLEIAKRDFKSYIKITRKELFDFEIESIKKKTIHHSSIGSIANKQDVANMIMLPQKKEINNKYDFLDISKNTPANKQYFYDKLQMNNIERFLFRNEEDIVEYFEKIS